MLRAAKCTLRTDSAQLWACTQKRFCNQRPTPHTTEKTHTLDVQSAASKSGMAEREKSRETTQTKNVKKQDPKKDYPEAPEPIIGMQDERGHSMLTIEHLSWSSLGIVLGV